MPVRLGAASAVLFLGPLRRLFGGGGPRVGTVDAAGARRLQTEEGAILVDVRETHEWRAGHAPGARHIPLGDIERKLAHLPKDRTIVVTCASGMRSRLAGRKLARHGFPHVLNMSGGMNAWRSARLPIER